MSDSKAQTDLVYQPSQAAGRLGDFSLAGRLAPAIAFVVVSLCGYVLVGYGPGLETLMKLSASYLVAYVSLALLAGIKGTNAPWSLVLPTAAFGIVAGGFAASAVVYAPDWTALLDTRILLPEWVPGAAFSAFFVGLSLVTGSARHEQQVEFEAKQRVLEARLQTLTARIEPHFLMNTLANLTELVKSEPDTAHAMLEHLVDLLQAALEQSRDLRSTLGQELKLIESYLTIMRMRRAEKLEFTLDDASEYADIAFPALLLQTLVENAVDHGIGPRCERGHIRVHVAYTEKKLTIAVSDDGVGFDTNNYTEGTGLQNVRERLQSFFGGNAEFSIDSNPDSGTIARVRFPVTA